MLARCTCVCAICHVCCVRMADDVPMKREPFHVCRDRELHVSRVLQHVCVPSALVRPSVLRRAFAPPRGPCSSIHMHLIPLSPADAGNPMRAWIARASNFRQHLVILTAADKVDLLRSTLPMLAWRDYLGEVAITVDDAIAVWGSVILVPEIKDASWSNTGYPWCQYEIDPASAFERAWQALIRKCAC